MNQQVYRGDLLECGLKGSPKAQASIGDDSQKLHSPGSLHNFEAESPTECHCFLGTGEGSVVL